MRGDVSEMILIRGLQRAAEFPGLGDDTPTSGGYLPAVCHTREIDQRYGDHPHPGLSTALLMNLNMNLTRNFLIVWGVDTGYSLSSEWTQAWA